MVTIADGERVGKSVIERQILTGVVSHGQWARLAMRRAALAHPRIHRAAVPCRVLSAPAMIEISHTLRVRACGVEAEWQHIAIRMDGIGLREDRPAIGKLRRVRIPEATHTGERPEVMVE